MENSRNRQYTYFEWPSILSSMVKFDTIYLCLHYLFLYLVPPWCICYVPCSKHSVTGLTCHKCQCLFPWKHCASVLFFSTIYSVLPSLDFSIINYCKILLSRILWGSWQSLMQKGSSLLFLPVLWPYGEIWDEVLIQVVAFSTGVTLGRFLNSPSTEEQKCVNMHSGVFHESADNENCMNDKGTMDFWGSQYFAHSWRKHWYTIETDQQHSW